MKTNFFCIYYLFILSALLLCSCERSADPELCCVNEDAIEFQSTIVDDDTSLSRANTADDRGWQGGEQVMVVVDGVQKAYTASSSGALRSDNPFFWTSITLNAEAYYPSTLAAIADQSTEEKYGRCDVLKAPRTTFIRNAQEQPSVQFKRQMAKVIVTLASGASGSTVPEATVRVLGCADVSYDKGTVFRNSEATQYFTVWKKGSNNYQVLIPPQNMTGKAFIEVKTKNHTYLYSPVGQINLEAGKVYEFTVLLNLRPLPNSKWMKYRTDDDQLISSVSIPGTHNSAATGGLKPIVSDRCQDELISKQLNDGVRYLDIRFGGDPNSAELKIYHGTVYQKKYFKEDVVQPVVNFLRANPSEFVIIQLKNEGPNSQTREEAYRKARNIFANVIGASNMLYLDDSKVPKVSDVRGKIVIIRREYISENLPFGFYVHFADNRVTDGSIGGQRLYVQDYYDYSWSAKWPKLEDGLNTAGNSEKNGFFINYSSCVNKSSIGIPRPNDASDNINPKLVRYLQNSGEHRKCGIVVMDYYNKPNNNAVEAIISKNPLVL